MTNLPEPTRTLARRLEMCHAWRSMRYTEAYQHLHPQARCAIEQIGGGYAIYVGPGSPLNNACGLGFTDLTQADAEVVLCQLEEFFANRGEPTRLHVSPLADEGFLAALRERGYLLHSFFSVLARVIEPGFEPAPPKGGLTITRALPEQAALWLKTSAEGFEGTHNPSEQTIDILGPNFTAEDAAVYFAWAEQPGSEPAAAGCGGLYLAPEIAASELGGASTRLAFRRRGAQRALIEARLAESLRQGCDLAMVMTEPGSNSERSLLRAGFVLAYTKPMLEKLL